MTENKQKKNFWQSFPILFIAIPVLFGIVMAFLQTKASQIFASVNAGLFPEPNDYSDYVENLPKGDVTTTFMPEVINIFFMLTGVALTIVMLYAGYLHVTNFGDTDQSGKANKLLYQAALGVGLIAASYAIVWGFTHITWNRT